MLLSSSLLGAQTTAGWTEPNSKIAFVKIEKGCFQMGAEHAGPGGGTEHPMLPMPNEVPRHDVCVDEFWLGKFEVTRAQWQRVMHPGAAEIAQPQRPMVKLSPGDARQFLQNLNAQAGDLEGQFRLPTEAEWEYACRAGEAVNADAEYTHGVDEENRLKSVAWYQRTAVAYSPETRDVGEMLANRWGLHDMLGNALELVQDDYDENGYSQHAKTNPVVIRDGARYVLRGGSFKSESWHARCSARMYGIAGDRLPTVGLRVVRTGKKGP